MDDHAIRTWQAQLRTIRHHFEHRLQTKIDKSSAMMEWLIVWVADILAKYRRENGRTTYEMNAQHIWKGKVFGIGEKFHY